MHFEGSGLITAKPLDPNQQNFIVKRREAQLGHPK